MASALVVCISLIYSTEFGGENNGKKKNNSNALGLNTHVQGIVLFLSIRT